jgi:hypothetical protein
VLNVVLVLGLAGAGVLKSAQTGDITTYAAEETPDGEIKAPPGNPFVVERPTDVDAFYDTVVRVRAGGPLFNPWGSAETVQRFHYHPFTFFVFFPLYFLGYVGFKIAWLVVSLGTTVTGTYLLLRAETNRSGELNLQRRWALGLATASVGFAPMVTNYKVGQTTPIMYLFVAAAWWFARRGGDTMSGAAVVGAAVIKPYFMTPLVLFWNRDRWRGVVGFLSGMIVITLVSALYFDPGTMVEYVDTLVTFVISTEGGSAGETEIGGWFASSLRMFTWLGPLAPVAQFLFATPFAYLTLVHLFRGSYEIELFALSTITVMFLISGTGVVDLAMVLAALVVLGVRFYGSYPRAFGLVCLSFVLMHSHPYLMETAVGWGAQNVAAIQQRTELILSIIPFVQPGIYGLTILLGLCLYSVWERTNGFPRPLANT